MGDGRSRHARTPARPARVAPGPAAGEISSPALASAVFEAALDMVGLAAFLLGPDGRVLHANASGRALRDRDPRHLADALARAIEGGDPCFAATPVETTGAPTHWLAVQRPEAVSAVDRVRAAARRWRLTRRQAEVLAEVARGLSNRDIATALGCAGSTVELHVTAVLDKAGCQSRAQLVARFWTEL